MEDNRLGNRKNQDKLTWSLVSWKALEPMVEVLMFGAKKYNKWNWSKGLSWVEICESMQRHLFAFIEGEDSDKESKLYHVGHILCNAMFLSYMFLFRKDLDDRYKEKTVERTPLFITEDGYSIYSEREVVYWLCVEQLISHKKGEYRQLRGEFKSRCTSGNYKFFHKLENLINYINIHRI